jgi:hypothetical protein
MNTKRLLLSTVTLALSLTAAPALAEPFTMNGTTYQVQDIAGTGTNQALLEVDFGTSAQSFLFGYEWNASASPNGRDILVALQANNDGLTFTDTYYASFDEHLLNTLSYNTLQPPDDYPNDFWLYFTSTDGQTFAEADYGYDAVPVTNGGFFAWALQTSDPNEDIYSPPYLPPSLTPAAIVGTPAPEPATLTLAGVTLLTLAHRRRR